MITDTQEPVCITVHCGYMAVENGSSGPLCQLFELARAVGIEVVTGCQYGDDRLYVKAEELSTVVELLEDAKLLYRLPEDPPYEWRGVKTAAVGKRLNILLENTIA